jgi:hypothetical protein
MYKTITVLVTCALALFAFACASGPGTDSANSGGPANSANMPEGLSTNPLPVNGSTPGIPAGNMTTVNLNAPGATPIPGIDPKHAMMTPNPDPHATPTPGIPSPAEIQKMRSAQGQQTMKQQANVPPAGPVQRSEEMKQGLNKKKPQE